MATARSSTDAPTSGFTEEQRSELSELIAQAVKGSAPPPQSEEPASKAPVVSDAEWGSMSDRQRQGWVESMVNHHLSELARADADYERDRKIAELSASKGPEPEKPPSVVTRLQKLIWGDPGEK